MIPGHNLWDSHNWILHLVVSFGLIGLVLCATYVVSVFREVYRVSRTIRFWRGECRGYTLILSWSLFEPVLRIPAVELLQAFLFVPARKYSNTAREQTLPLAGVDRRLAITPISRG